MRAAVNLHDKCSFPNDVKIIGAMLIAHARRCQACFGASRRMLGQLGFDEETMDGMCAHLDALPISEKNRAFVQFARFVWAVGKNAVTGVRSSIPDMLARAERDFPAGFFSLAQLEQYMRGTFEARGLANSFAALRGTLLIPAVDLDRAERVVFGRGALATVPISEAVAASSAIPGFFEPFRINGRDYVDGGVGFSGHADIAADAGADIVIVVNPLVPSVYEAGGASIRQRGMYFIMEQTNRIYTQNLLRQNLDAMAARHPKTDFFVIQPPPSGTPLFGPSMGFEASRAALRYGLTSTREWLDAAGAEVVRRITVRAVPTTA